MTRKLTILIGLVAMVTLACLFAFDVISEEVCFAASIGTFGIATVLDDELAALVTQVTATKGAEASAVVALNAVPAKIQAAVDAALAAGATPTQLQQLTDLTAALKTSADPLAAAVAANP